MTGQWRTVFGSAIIGASVFGGGDVVTVGEAGDVFSLSAGDFDSGGFRSTATAVVEPDPKTELALRATRLSDGKIAVDSLGPNPKIWLIGRGAQIAASFAVEKPLEAAPVQINAGLVLPAPGRLRLVSPASGVPAAEDHLAPVEGVKTARWTSLERVSNQELVALDSHGRLSLFQYRTEPVHQLAEVVTKNLNGPCDSGLAVVASRVVYADAEGALHFLDASTLEPVATHKLPAPAVGRLWTAGSLVVVESRDQQLAVYDASGPTKPLFVAALGETGPSGPPALLRDRLIVAFRDGAVVAIDPVRGAVVARASVGEALSGGVVAVDGRPVVTTIDGSLCRVDSVLESPKK
jgi:hypothetical protein